MTVEPYTFGATQAERVVLTQQITTLPIDPFALAADRDIKVVAKPPSAAGCSGILVRVGNDYAIGYATHIPDESFHRFSVSHELGHYFIPGHPDAVLDENGRHESHAQYLSKDIYEMQADGFAASLLMPRALFTAAMKHSGSGLHAIECLHDLCKTSLHATAIRYSQCTRDPFAIVVSTGSTIDHCFMSGALKEFPGLDWLKKRSTLSPSTATFQFNQDRSNVLTSARVDERSTLETWFGVRADIELREEVIGLGKYGKALTVLSDIEIPEPEDDEDEQDMLDSWKPRFRR